MDAIYKNEFNRFLRHPETLQEVFYTGVFIRRDPDVFLPCPFGQVFRQSCIKMEFDAQHDSVKLSTTVAKNNPAEFTEIHHVGFDCMSRQNDVLIQEISECAGTTSDPAGRTIAIISDFDTLRLARHHNVTPRQVHLSALDQNIWPLRYLRNFDSLTPTDQIKLLETRATVIGAGGLGGYLLELLARTGIGTLVAADPETFDETNLNRQTLARTDTVNQFKTDTAAKALFLINPAIDIITHRVRIDPGNIDAILYGSHVAVDALDNAEDRLTLQESCARQNIPMVHGAIAGFEGRVMTVYPGDQGLQLLYGHNKEEEEPSAELHLGVPAVTPAFIASLQTMEVLKIVLNRGRPFRNQMLHADLENGRFEEFILDV